MKSHKKGIASEIARDNVVVLHRTGTYASKLEFIYAIKCIYKCWIDLPTSLKVTCEL